MVDFNEIMQNFNTAVNNFVEKTKAYFQSLTQYELYAWIAIGVGFVMTLIALITW
jgi:hypothetical protein